MALTLARLTMALVSSLSKPPVIIDLPQLPIDAFNLCGTVVDLKLMLVPSSVGTVFGKWLRSLLLSA